MSPCTDPVLLERKGSDVSILWIVLIVLLVLALLGFLGRGRYYG
jgi:hypothetical protein